MRVGTSVERATTALCICLAHPHVASGFGVRALTSRRSAAATSLLESSGGMSTTTGAEIAAVAILPAKAPLPLLDDGITVLSFNVLLPNGNDGWWMYKVCLPVLDDETYHTIDDERVLRLRTGLSAFDAPTLQPRARCL